MDSKDNLSTNRTKTKIKKLTKKATKHKSTARINDDLIINIRTPLERFVLDNINVQSGSIRTERPNIEPERVRKERKQEIQQQPIQTVTFPSGSYVHTSLRGIPSKEQQNTEPQKPKKECTNCALLNHRLKMEIQKSAHLKMQNSNLENAVAEKREILYHLSIQIKDLHKEKERMFKVLTKIQNEELSPHPEPSSPKGFKNNTPSTVTDFQVGIRTKNPMMKPQINKPTLNIVDFEDKMHLLQRNTNILSDKMDNLRKENVEKTKFLCNLLYTLHAKGYEMIRDQHGKVFDLEKVKGEVLLEIRGRDIGSVKSVVKKINPHEVFLKAVIGSQEKTIQDLWARVQELDEVHALNNNNAEFQACNVKSERVNIF